MAADVSEWQTSDDGFTTGHTQFPMQVGPGVLTLEDGTELVVPADTLGANQCIHLAEDRWEGGSNLCFAIGEYVEDGPEVAWFSLVGDGPELPDGHIEVTVHDVEGGQAIVDETGRLFRFDLADTVDLSTCFDAPEESAGADLELPRAAAYEGHLDVAAREVYAITCGYSG